MLRDNYSESINDRERPYGEMSMRKRERERERERGCVDALRERKARLLRGVLEGLRGWEVFWMSEAVLLGE